jgi:hypothetical protein
MQWQNDLCVLLISRQNYAVEKKYSLIEIHVAPPTTQKWDFSESKPPRIISRLKVEAAAAAFLG